VGRGGVCGTPRVAPRRLSPRLQPPGPVAARPDRVPPGARTGHRRRRRPILSGPMDHVTITTSDGVRLSVRTWKPSGTPRAHVVLVHGFTASTADRKVLSVAGDLTSAGFDVFAYDARGHGRSGGATTLGNLERHDVAAAVEAVRATSTTGPIVVVG